ncbi:MAG: class I SAM-dependent methyltransferase [Acidobacteriota bacterium]
MAFAPFVQEYVSALTEGDPRFVPEIDSRDEMYSYGLHSLRGNPDAAAILYFLTGRQIADTVLAARRWRFENRDPGVLLDFASGFGRATRFLTLTVPPGSLWVSEIDAAAVAFQESRFSVSGVVSSKTAAEFNPPRRFDAIAASSFFSHVPAGPFEDWLARFYDLVNPGGVLVFSTHGPSLLTEEADWSTGLVFRGQSETERLDPSDYGTSYVRPEFVEAAAARVSGGEAALHYVPFGLCGHQDLFLLARPPHLPVRPPSVPRVPRGELHTLQIRDGGERLAVEGWIEAERESVVTFFVENRPLAVSRPEDGETRRSWSFDVELRGVSSDAVLRIEASTRAGTTKILAMGTLRPYL